jgi:hypothetical protein
MAITPTPKHRQLSRGDVPRVALDMDEVGQSFGISTPKVYGLVEAGDLRTFLLGRRRLATIDAVRDCARTLEQREGPLPSASGLNNQRDSAT